jgi:MYXO-CTERM domain-containing protein
MCGSQIGTCSMGITRCVAGRIVCDQTSMPRDEMCNGLDDDCNTLIDDGIFPETGRTCLCPGLTAAQAGVGTCKAGKLVCRGAEGFVCEGCILPEMEICDGKDNDCDGIPDQAAMCPSGFGCREGACTLLCMPTEFPCPTGYDCDMNGFCVPNRCRNVRCEVEMRCDNNTGSCVDLCFGVNCLPGATCERGQCLDCSNSAKYACQAGYRCASRMCIMDPCAGVTCNGDEYCEEGNCMPLRCDNDCPPGQRCIGGRCRIYMCENVSCAPLYCEWATGNCLPDRCRTQTCPYCVQETGECLNADPCRDLACPANGCWSCALDPAGVAYCKEESDCLTLRVVATSTGGGCACDVGAGTPPSPAAALAALVGLGLLGVLRGPGRRRWRRRNG